MECFQREYPYLCRLKYKCIYTYSNKGCFTDG